MKQGVAAASAARSVTGTVLRVLSRPVLAAVPVVSLGMLGAVPSMALAFRQGARADWLAALVFAAVNVAWLAQAVLTPVDTHGLQYAADVVLLLGSTVVASLHYLWRSTSASKSR